MLVGKAAEIRETGTVKHLRERTDWYINMIHMFCVTSVHCRQWTKEDSTSLVKPEFIRHTLGAW